MGAKLSDKLDLSLYDTALRAGGGGAEFFISATDKTDQWRLLSRALLTTPSYDREIAPTKLTHSEKCPRSFIEGQIQIAIEQASNIILSNLEAKFAQDRRFDPVRDYGYLVTHLMVNNVIGLKMRRRAHPLYHLFRFVNWVRGQKNTTLKASKIKQANELVFWIEVMFAQLFINPGNHNKAILYASKIISKRYQSLIRKSLNEPKSGSLIERMTKCRLDLALSNERFEKLVINIVMELVGSFQYLTGRGFAGVYETIMHKYAEQEDCGLSPLKTFNAQLRLRPRPMLDEAMRHNSPTGFIFRTASVDFIYNGISISSGDLVCLLCDQAVKDPSVFTQPETFYSPDKAAKHQNDYLAFASPDTSPSPMRPSENHHPCFGQHWARIMLKSMLIGLEALESNLKEQDGRQGKT